MADEIRATRTGDIDANDDPDAARADIEQTRARMSETIDDIEDVLVRRKEEIQDRLDVMAPVRERPLPSAGIVFGAGLLLGLLTGGGDDADEHEARHRRHRHHGGRHGRGRRHAGEADGRDRSYWQRRAETWESRARRLRDAAVEQEEQLRSAQEAWGEERARLLDREPQRHEHGHSAGGRMHAAVHGVRDSLSEGVANFISHAIDQFSGHDRH